MFSDYSSLLNDDTKSSEYSKLSSNLSSNLSSSCSHDIVVSCKGIAVCQCCGIEIVNPSKSIGCKYNGLDCSSTTIDGSRCHISSAKRKSIFKDLENSSIDEGIKDRANDIFIQACKNKVHRGNKRKSIIIAAIFMAYKESDTPRSWESISKCFKVSKKEMINGLKFLHNNMKKNTIPYKSITPAHIINEHLNAFQISGADRDDILSLYKKIQYRSAVINKSRPQSVAAGVIWHWISENTIPISLVDFKNEVNLSELTIHKICKEIKRILEQFEA